MGAEMPTSIESLAIEQLNEAISAIDKRSDTHGSAGRTLVRAAKVCRIIGLDFRHPSDLALCLAILKISRITNGDRSHFDSYVDGAAYIALASAIQMGEFGDWEDDDTD
ncbi:MAG: hypothetical protein EBT92_19050 [Planctomycetes bacterium]|jgi:hypothetical protein|nr:hypothetical protein [Planctomycetota bacterium]